MSPEQRDKLIEAAKEIGNASMAFADGSAKSDRLVDAWTAFHKALGGNDSVGKEGG